MRDAVFNSSAIFLHSCRIWCSRSTKHFNDAQHLPISIQCSGVHSTGLKAQTSGTRPTLPYKLYIMNMLTLKLSCAQINVWVGLFWRCADINTKCWPINTYKCMNWTFTLDFLILLQWNCDFQSINFVIELIIELSLEHAVMYLIVVWPLPVYSIQSNKSGIVSVRRLIFVFNFNSNIACRAYQNRECHSMVILNTAHISLI